MSNYAWHRAGMDPRWINDKVDDMKTLQTREFEGVAAPEWATAVAITEGLNSWFWEESVNREDGKRFLRLGNPPEWTSRYSGPNSCKLGTTFFLPPVVSPEDQLPDAPTSGVYLSHTGRRVVRLELGNSINGKTDIVILSIDGVFKRVRMTAETARAMASDLYRMARHLEKLEQE